MRRASRNVFGVAVGAVVLAAATVAYIGTAAPPAHAESNGGTRVMPLGDSITDGITVSGAYRTGLWQRVGPAGFRVDFVGTLFGGPSALGDHDHEGHSGWRIDMIDANIVGWLQTANPHTVLLHIGTNDVLQNNNLAAAPTRLSGLIDKITNTVPTAEVFVATIIPLANAGQENAVRTYNAAIPGIVQGKVNAGRHVHLVDMHAALTAADLADGIHPNAGGYDKMAATWFNALRSVPGSLGGTATTTPPTTTPTSPPPTSPPPTSPPPGRGCTATYTVTNQWPTGFQASVQVTAGGSAITSWTVTWTFANGQTVSQFWNTALTPNAAAITARNLSYNGSLAAGARTEFGFTANLNGTANSVPAVACTAG